MRISKKQIHVVFACVLVAFLIYVGEIINIKLYSLQYIWSIGLYRCDGEDVENCDGVEPDIIFSPRRLIRTTYNYCTGYADPFLFVKDGYLYLFYEKELSHGPGVINVKRTANFDDWEDLGTVLQENFHLSYPHVFEEGGHVYMIPETNQNNSVTLYESLNFPYEWVPVKNIMTGHKYADSDILKKGDMWYLFSLYEDSSNPGLHLYTSSDLLGEFQEHEMSPISVEPLNWRCGGPVFSYQGQYYRPAQKCDIKYGENLALYNIGICNDSIYEESYVKYLYTEKRKWNERGGHHFCSVVFNGDRIIAMDGLQKDSWINNRTRKFYEGFNGRL